MIKTRKSEIIAAGRENIAKNDIFRCKKAAREARPIGEAVLIRMLPKSTISFSCEEAEEPQAAQARRIQPSNRRRPSRTAEASHRRR